MRKLMTILTLFGLFVVSTPAAPVFDESFGPNGVAETSIPREEKVVDVLFHQNGQFTLVLGGSNYGFARFNSDGTPDTDFGKNGIFRGPNIAAFVNAGVVSDFDKMIVAGYAPAPDGNSPTDFYVARHNLDGSIDTSFAVNGEFHFNQSTSDHLEDIALQSDGKIVVSGRHNDGGIFGAVLRLNPNGTLDKSFGQGGYLYSDEYMRDPGEFARIFPAVTVKSDGTILTAIPYERFDPGPNDRRGFTTYNIESDGSAFTKSGQTLRVGLKHTGFDIASEGDTTCYVSTIYLGCSDSNFSLKTRYTGQQLSMFKNGRAVSIEWYGGSPLTIFSSRSIISRVTEGLFPGSPAFEDIVDHPKVFANPDGRILTVYESTDGNYRMQSILRVTSQGTRNGFGGRPAVLDPATSTVRILTENDNVEVRAVKAESRPIPEYQTEYWSDNNAWGGLVPYWTTSTLSPSYFFAALPDGNPNQVGSWGLPEDIPVGGDYDGDSFQDYTVFRPSDGVWYSARGGGIVKWGQDGDKPVPADYDYDGITDRAVYRPSTGEWWILKSSGGFFAARFGLPDDIPITGDFDADGYADLTVYRPSEGNWYQYLTTEGFRVIRFGLETDYPLSADFDGDGRFDIAVYREGEWHILQSRDGYRIVNFGELGEIPVTTRYDEGFCWVNCE